MFECGRRWAVDCPQSNVDIRKKRFHEESAEIINDIISSKFAEKKNLKLRVLFMFSRELRKHLRAFTNSFQDLFLHSLREPPIAQLHPVQQTVELGRRTADRGLPKSISTAGLLAQQSVKSLLLPPLFQLQNKFLGPVLFRMDESSAMY